MQALIEEEQVHRACVCPSFLRGIRSSIIPDPIKMAASSVDTSYRITTYQIMTKNHEIYII